MPIKDLFGGHLPRDQVFEGHLSANPTARNLPPLQPDLYCRNGQAPSATWTNQLNDATNFACLYRTKTVLQAVGRIRGGGLASGGAGPRNRFRSAFHTGPFHSSLVAIVLMVPTTSTVNSYARLTIFSDATESTTVTSVDFNQGVNPTATEDWDHVTTLRLDVTGLDPDTTYYARFDDYNDARLISAVVYENASLTESNYGGYVASNYAAGSPIFEHPGGEVNTILRDLWRRSGSMLFNYFAHDGSARTVVGSTTLTNIIDNASTAVSAATPGYIFNMYLRDSLRESSTGVPCRLSVFGHMDGGTATGGKISILDDTGTPVVTMTDVFTPTPQWVTTTFYLPATNSDEKYDVMYACSASGGTFSVYAISAYEYTA